MSLTYGTLKTLILDEGHRPGLGDTKAADFVRYAEGFIARRLRAAEMLERVTLTDADRVDAGIFSLPEDYLEERSLWRSDNLQLKKVSLAALRGIHTGSQLLNYAVLSSEEIEFRGVPGDTETIELIYFARPATFALADDTNEILTRHEAIYLQAGLAGLYRYTQDLELSAEALGIAETEIETLNEQTGRMIGGGATQGGYDLSPSGSY